VTSTDDQSPPFLRQSRLLDTPGSAEHLSALNPAFQRHHDDPHPIGPSGNPLSDPGRTYQRDDGLPSPDGPTNESPLTTGSNA
jgi:hypothetical protein